MENMVLRGVAVESVKKEWEKFRDIVTKCTNDVCVMRRVCGHRREEIEVNGGMKKLVSRWPKN